MDEAIAIEMPGKAFAEGHVQAAGYRIRYAQAGAGPALVFLPASCGLTYSPGLDLLAGDFRVERLPNCKTLIVPGAGHDVPGEQPEADAAAVKAFIAAAARHG